MTETRGGCAPRTGEQWRHEEEKVVSFSSALRKNQLQNKVSVVSEVKRMSPSRGLFKQNFKPQHLLKLYDVDQTTCFSVLTDQRLFGGDGSHLKAIKTRTSIPVLRKDFVVSKLQILETFLIGADAVLIIVAILGSEQIATMWSLIRVLNLEVLFETGSSKDVRRVLKFNPSFIGINNRNINNFSINPTNSLRILRDIPSGCIILLESGIRCWDDVLKFVGSKVCCFLVGEFYVG